MTTDTVVAGTRDSSTVEFVITNYTEDLALDADAAAVAETNDVLATVIRELINLGILKGSVATA